MNKTKKLWCIYFYDEKDCFWTPWWIFLKKEDAKKYMTHKCSQDKAFKYIIKPVLITMALNEAPAPTLNIKNSPEGD